MNDTASPPDSGADAAAAGATTAAMPPAAAPTAVPVPAATSVSVRGLMIGAAVVGALAVASLTLAVFTQQRVKTLEQELVRRQQDSQNQAIEALFKVKVVKINTITTAGKTRRFGASQSQQSDVKKAIATLKAGDKIQLFEGA